MPSIDDILNARRRQPIFDRVVSGSSSTAPAPPSIYERLSQGLTEPLPMEGRLSLLPAMVTPERGREWAVPGVLAGAWNAFTAPGRALQGQELGPEEALNVAGTAMLGGMPVARAAGVGGPGELGLNVFHGSPHKFAPHPDNPLGKFDPSRIGTGEGNQAYGVGAAYLAEERALGENYRRMLSENKIPDVEGLARGAGLNLSRDARAEIQRFGGQGTLEPMAAARALQATNAELRGVNTKKLASVIEQYRAEKSGYLYKVDVPDEHIPRMLDWDTKLGQMPKETQDAVKKIWAEKRIFGDPFKLNGQGIWGSLVAATSKQEATELLRQAGIPGTKYLDRASRSAGEGTRNFVVFDPEHANILSRE